MGGYGSTRWDSTPTRPLTTWARRLDVATLRRVPFDGGVLDVLREGLPPGGYMEWGEGDSVLRLCVETGDDGRACAVTSRYRSRAPGGAWRPREMRVSVVWRPCNLGGEQPLFVCPACRRDRRSIFVNGPTACCECLGLAYPSTRENEAERAERRARRIWRRLDPDGTRPPRRGMLGLALSAPPKPRGMHWRTYDRLARRYRHAVEVAHAHHMAGLAMLVQRLDGAEPLGGVSADDWRADARDLARMGPPV